MSEWLVVFSSLMAVVGTLLGTRDGSGLVLALFGFVVVFVSIPNLANEQLSSAYTWLFCVTTSASVLGIQLTKTTHKQRHAAAAMALLNVPSTKHIEKYPPWNKSLMYASVYASVVSWSMLTILWVGTLFGNQNASGALVVGATALVSSCAVFEVSGRLRQYCEVCDTKNGFLLLRNMLVDPSVAVGLMFCGFGLATCVFPWNVALSYCLSVCMWPMVFLAFVSFKHAHQYMWDVRVSAECAWWATMLALDVSSPKWWVPQARTDDAALAVSILALVVGAVSLAYTLSRSLPYMWKFANDHDTTPSKEADTHEFATVKVTSHASANPGRT